ncbi:MAG: ABC transporter ATP-binding protein [Firmicutes bacterium]|nr:ABC transporter ATP-binding protein [Bacillota bacterium]
MKSSILSAKGLCRSYAHDGIQNHVLQHVDFDLYEGDFTVIMGPSGSGKSTLLYCLSGMDRATAGEVTYEGKNLVTMSEKDLTKLRSKDFGFIFQQMHLVSNLTLYENVAIAGYLDKSMTSDEVRTRTDGLMTKMDISDVSTHLPSQVSGGQQQRCAIARAVVSKPRIIFADEPTGSLNRKNSEEVLDLLMELNREGQSILMVTHDMKAAMTATRLLYLDDGDIIGELVLPPYDPKEARSRETQVNAWLSSMEW